MMRHRIAVFAAILAALSLSAVRAQTDSAADSLYWYSAGVQTPGHPLLLQYGTNAERAQTIRVSVYRISEKAYVDDALEVAALTEASARRGRLVATAKSVPPAAPDEWERRVEVPALPAGLYAVVAQMGKATVVNALDVTTVGIVRTDSYAPSQAVLIVPIDLRSFDRYAAGARVQTAGANAGENAGRDVPLVDGIARWDPLQSGASEGIVVRVPDGSVAVQRIDGAGTATPAPREIGYVQSDRPVYRPGDTVALRVLVRDGFMGAFSLPQGTRRVRVQAPDGSDVYSHDVAFSDFGTLSASVRLPQDAQTGSYSVTVGDAISSTVLVAAYKKPEYELQAIDAPRFVVGGESASFGIAARYFFGRPAAGLTVHYVVRSTPHDYWWWWGPYGTIVENFGVWRREEGKEIASGTVRTDAAGRAPVAFATNAVKNDNDLQATIDARDASGRTVSTTVTVLETAAALQTGIAPDQWFGQAGVRQSIRVTTRGYAAEDERVGNVPVHVTIAGRRWEKDREVQISQAAFDVTTDARGDASLDWTPAQGGDYILTARAYDAAGRVATATTYLWVLAGGENAWLAPIERPILVAQRQTVEPAGRARFVLALPKSGRDAIVVASTDRVVSAQIVHVAGTSALVSVDVPADATSMNVTALLPNENGVDQASTSVTVAPAERVLRVSVTPGKARYAPGERATFAVRAVDAQGRPQRAELGIGVVDEAIYAVARDESGDPVEAFYGASVNAYGTASWFRPNAGRALGMVRAGSEADIYSVNAAAKSAPAPAGTSAGPAVRSNFADTAYWAPNVVTGDDGRGTVSFVWPDNLTTWRATALGITRSSDVGRGTGSTLVTKDFLVRLEMPRFLRAGDRSTISGIAHGVASAPSVRLQLDAGALASGPLGARLHLDAYQSAAASWPVKAPGVGSVLVTLRGGDGTRSDAMQLPLPLEAGTAAEHVRDAGSLATRSAFTASVPPGYLAGDLHLTLSPSLIAELVANQRLLDVYPYYCTEQTMSAGLPAVFIGRVASRAHVELPQDVSVGQIVAHAVARLKQLQHADGSWGWWENDDGHPFMTAYALYGLSEFRRSGYTVPDAMYSRGIQSLADQLANAKADTLAFWGGAQRGSAWNTRAYMLFSLAYAAPEKVDAKILAQTFDRAGDLNSYALAVLGLAERRLGHDGAARSLLSRLDARAVRAGAFTYWRSDTWHYAWEDDPIEATAYALRFETAMGAPAERIDPIVNFLRLQNRGSWWYTTKDTAAAVDALADAIRPNSSEFDPDETVRVLVDGRAVRSLRITRPILDAADASLVVPAQQMRWAHTIAFERSGRGTLYWSSDAVRYVPPSAAGARDPVQPLLERLFAPPAPVEIERRYRAPHAGAWRVGDEIQVDVTVRVRETTQYVAIEDPFPAGAEHQTEQGRAQDDAWGGIQLLDDRAVFFADTLYANQPIAIRYTLRVTTPGTYTAPAPTVYAMYGPPVSALGKQQTVEVVP